MRIKPIKPNGTIVVVTYRWNSVARAMQELCRKRMRCRKTPKRIVLDYPALYNPRFAADTGEPIGDRARSDTYRKVLIVDTFQWA